MDRRSYLISLMARELVTATSNFINDYQAQVSPFSEQRLTWLLRDELLRVISAFRLQHPGITGRDVSEALSLVEGALTPDSQEACVALLLH